MEKQHTGRIVRSISGFYDVQTGGAVITCRARGILRKENCTPLTGDMVDITVERGKGMVEKGTAPAELLRPPRRRQH